MRVGVMTAIGIGVSIATPSGSIAEPRFDTSVFAGVGWFSDDTELGNSWAPEQVPGTSAVIGGRVGWIPFPALIDRGDTRVQLGAELELSIAPAFTGSEMNRRDSYFAPVFGWRAHAIARLAGLRKIVAHVTLGAGGETVASTSPFMAKETDPVVYWGLGASAPMTTRWAVRLDLRHGLMPGRDDATSSTIELQFGVATTFGVPSRVVVHDEPEAPVARDEDTDSDGDGLPDRIDECPKERETINGISDSDGCAEPDPDGDGRLGTADACPTAAEDFDRFRDEDGCPDPDNDGDTIEDARDICPLEPETPNGITDDDGCPDKLPEDVGQALVEASGIKFEPTRARVTPAAKTALRRLLTRLRNNLELRISIIGHPNTAGGPSDNDLAKRRAEAVKWYLVDEGVVADRIETSVGPVAPRAVEIKLARPASAP